MSPKEDYTSFIAVGFVLTLAVLAIFQVYIWREPGRIQQEVAHDLEAAISDGKNLYAENCSSCHGVSGSGGIGPALNVKDFLALTSDETLFSLTRTGVPGTRMPAWGQSTGGPFTDEQISHLVAFLRSWGPTAPELEPVSELPDPSRGATIYQQTCFICHGEDGKGTDIAPGLNDPERLGKLDDAWYRATISHGRPAKGMPTWGTVLSPDQINDLVALISAWREGRPISPDIPLATIVTNALFALREFDRPDAIFYLNQAWEIADIDQRAEIETITQMIDENHLFEGQGMLINFLPPEEMGRAVYDTNCAACHGVDGSGGMGPNLHANDFIQTNTNDSLVNFVLDGRRGTAMDGFEGILGAEEINNVVVLLRLWQP